MAPNPAMSISKAASGSSVGRVVALITGLGSIGGIVYQNDRVDRTTDTRLGTVGLDAWR